MKGFSAKNTLKSGHTALLSKVAEYIEKMKSEEEADMISVLVFLKNGSSIILR